MLNVVNRPRSLFILHRAGPFTVARVSWQAEPQKRIIPQALDRVEENNILTDLFKFYLLILIRVQPQTRFYFSR